PRDQVLHGQFSLILLALSTMSPDALTVIFLPLITISPFFFIEKVAEPHLTRNSSPASIVNLVLALAPNGPPDPIATFLPPWAAKSVPALRVICLPALSLMLAAETLWLPTTDRLLAAPTLTLLSPPTSSMHAAPTAVLSAPPTATSIKPPTVIDLATATVSEAEAPIEVVWLAPTVTDWLAPIVTV